MLALALAAACADSTEPDVEAAAPTTQAGTDLASAAVAALTADRSGSYQIVIPDDTRTESTAIVLHYHGKVVDRWRFVRGGSGWTAAERLDSTVETVPAGTGPQLDRGTWTTSAPYNTPKLAKVSLAYPDGTFPEDRDLYPVRYSGGTTYRWTTSAEVVSGLEDGIKDIRSSAFLTNGIVRWSAGDSIFTVDAYRKWTFGEWGTGALRQECSLTGLPATTVCYANINVFRSGWTDAYYHITVAKATATSISVSPTTVQAQPGQTAQLTATVRDQYGSAMSAPVTWSSSNASIASVSSSGLVTVHALGDAVITATSGTLTASVTVASRASVTLSGATSVYEGWHTATSNVNPAGSYYYVWTFERCHFRETVRKCELAKPLTSGQDVTSASIYISKYDDFVRYHVSVRQYEGGPSLASTTLKVYGAGLVFGSNTPCGGLRVCPS